MKRIVTCLEDIEGGEKTAIESLHKGLTKTGNGQYHFKLIKYSPQLFSNYTTSFFASICYFLSKTYKTKKDILIITAPQHFFTLLLCSSKIKTVYSFHGDKSFHFNEIRSKTKHPLKLLYGYFWVILQNFLFQSALKKVNLIFVPNQLSKKYLVNLFPLLESKKIMIVPNGVDTQKFHPVLLKEKVTLQKEVGIPLKKTVLSYIGRIDYLKGIDLILPFVKKNKSEIYFLIIHPKITNIQGKTYKEKLETIIVDSELEENVKFINGNFVDIEKWYQCSDCVVLPSSIEQSSMTIKEAMACSVPIISTKTGDTSELLQNIERRLIVKNPILFNLDKSLKWVIKLNQKDKILLGSKLRKAVIPYSIENSIEFFYAAIHSLN